MASKSELNHVNVAISSAAGLNAISRKKVITNCILGRINDEAPKQILSHEV